MLILEPFFIRAWLAGLGIALMAGPLGCFIVWRRLAYFGDTIGHAALLGVALGLLLQVDMTLAIIVVSALLTCLILRLEKGKRLASDTLLGVAAHGALALGLVVIALAGIRIDINGYLFGDILAVNITDIIRIYAISISILICLSLWWEDLMRTTLHADIAQVEGVPVEKIRFFLMIIIAVCVAAAIKIVGMLLITSLLIIPAACARYFSTTPTQMTIRAIVAGMVAVTLGLLGSALADTPSGPSIILAALALFLLIASVDRFKRRV